MRVTRRSFLRLLGIGTAAAVVPSLPAVEAQEVELRLAGESDADYVNADFWRVDTMQVDSFSIPPVAYGFSRYGGLDGMEAGHKVHIPSNVRMYATLNGRRFYTDDYYSENPTWYPVAD